MPSWDLRLRVSSRVREQPHKVAPPAGVNGGAWETRTSGFPTGTDRGSELPHTVIADWLKRRAAVGVYLTGMQMPPAAGSRPSDKGVDLAERQNWRPACWY